MKIFKLSLGKQHFNDAKLKDLLDKGLVSVHPSTLAKGQKSETQGQLFLEVDKGDVFFVCRSNQSVEYIGMFTDKRPLFSIIEDHEDWVDKSIEYLFFAEESNDYDKKLDKWWSPKNNSTFIEIQHHDYDLFEKKILNPVFKITLAELEDKRNESLNSLSFTIEDCLEKQNYFSNLFSDPTYLFIEVNKIDSIEIGKLKYSFSKRGDISKQPVVLLRSKLLYILQEKGAITLNDIENTKEELSKGFEKNVYHAWSSPFRILYPFLFESFKKDLEKSIDELINRLIEDLRIADKVNVNLVHFDGPQNQGFDRVWFAIYNNTYKTQKLAKQLFFNISGGFEYGLLDQQNRSNNDLKRIEKFDYDKIKDMFLKHVKSILNDNSMELEQLSEYINVLEHKKQIILQGPPGTGKTFTAEKLAQTLVPDLNPEQYQLVQFHPSYSYEDFVRGIIAKTNNKGQVEYVTENKILCEFALRARLSKLVFDNPVELPLLFMHYLQKEQEKASFNNTHFYFDAKTRLLDIYNPDSQSPKLRYEVLEENGDWKMITWIDIKENFTVDSYRNKGGIIHRSEMYKSIMIDLTNDSIFKSFTDFASELVFTTKEFVLVIDEINRANLPSVLGELIYALEYRNKPVKSMYAVDGEANIILPDNLYIIGTMNTADRSVGHIDYAIKRRFAFVDVLPSDAPIQNEKAKELFKAVSRLFVEKGKNSIHLASDFNFKEVQLGHSYFIVENDDELKMKLQYEIIPILNEYVKDGLLLESATEIIDGLSID